MNARSSLFVFSLFGSISLSCAAEPKVLMPAEFVRARSDFAPWAEAGDALVDVYRKDLKPPADAKIVPLFLCVRLTITNPDFRHLSLDGKPDRQAGSRIFEWAVMHSEVRLKNGTNERKIVLFARFPYENPKWRTEEMVSISEGEGSWSSILVLNESGDIQKQISDFVRKATDFGSKDDHIMSFIAFQRGVSSVFGKDLDDNTLLDMCCHDYLDPEKKKSARK